jgi:hypothetical protein
VSIVNEYLTGNLILILWGGHLACPCLGIFLPNSLYQFSMKLDKILNHEGAKNAKKEIKGQKI